MHVRPTTSNLDIQYGFHVECFRPNISWTALLEPGVYCLVELHHCPTHFHQVDDDGESYWVFESRDVRFGTHLLHGPCY
jgi:hypothetical protein